MATVNSTKYNRNRKRVDCMTATITLGDVGGGVDLVSGDVIQLFKVPAGAVVLDVIVNKKTSFNAGTSCTLSVGDGGSATRFHNAIDVKTATGLVASAGIPYQYATSDTIDAVVTITGAITTGELEVEVVFLSPNEVTGFMTE